MTTEGVVISRRSDGRIGRQIARGRRYPRLPQQVVGFVISGIGVTSAAWGQSSATIGQAVSAATVAALPLVLEGVTVVDVERGTLVPSQRVVIVGNRIQMMEGAGRTPTPQGARVVSVRGKYLIPGLWDMHTHINVDLGPYRYQPYLSLLANGVTGIRDAGAAVPLDTLRQWRQDILAGTRIGPPRQIHSGAAINGDQCRNDCHPGIRGVIPGSSPVHVMVSDSIDARILVDSLVAAGADMIKPREVDTTLYRVIVTEAARLGVPFGGHAAGDHPGPRGAAWVTPLHASDLGARVIDHELGGATCWGSADSRSGPTRIDVEACRRNVHRFRRNDTWFVTVAAIGQSSRASFPGLERLARAMRSFQDGSPVRGNWIRRTVGRAASRAIDTAIGGPGSRLPDSLRARRLVQRELPVLIGSDSWPMYMGFMEHVQLWVLVKEGWTTLDALRAATLNPAKAFHVTDSLGTVAVGKLADLVLLDANPLDDITNTTTIRAVIANGRYFDRVALDNMLAAARREPGDSSRRIP